MGVRASYQAEPKQTGIFVFRIESHLSQWETEGERRFGLSSLRTCCRCPVLSHMEEESSESGTEDWKTPQRKRESQRSEPRTCCGKMACNLAKNQKENIKLKTEPEKENKGNKKIVWQDGQPKEPANEESKGKRLISKAVGSSSGLKRDPGILRTPIPNPILILIHSKLIYVLFALFISAQVDFN